ncbi:MULTISPECIES: hypothetical protein [unclassified Frankia]|uniref:hypothetical protein n=1 Tax=unclassified Frankia TaxID=2632575 RepID=UPI001EF73A02|nr:MULTISPECIES: hypothetical protein [unclassified Frankia]
MPPGDTDFCRSSPTISDSRRNFIDGILSKRIGINTGKVMLIPLMAGSGRWMMFIQLIDDGRLVDVPTGG